MSDTIYLGKELPPPFDGPQFTPIENPDKDFSSPKPTLERDAAIIEKVFTQCSLPELERWQQRLMMAITVRRANAQKPNRVFVQHWQGTIARQGRRCGKDDCPCATTDYRHGPYYYHRPHAYVRPPGQVITERAAKGRRKAKKK